MVLQVEFERNSLMDEVFCELYCEQQSTKLCDFSCSLSS